MAAVWLWIAVGLLLLGLLAAWVLLVQLLGQQGRLLLRLEALEEQLSLGSHGHAEDQPEGLPVRSQIPSFRLLDLAGQSQDLEACQTGNPFGNPVVVTAPTRMEQAGRWI
jgi:hypothetical protein